MILGYFHQGSGLGNQLHRYVATRVLALDKGYEFAMLGNFKGESFMDIDYGTTKPCEVQEGEFNEKKVVENGVDIRSYDPEINFVEDNTIIDGEFQDERYFAHRLDEVRDWLAVEWLDMPDDVCVIGFRGGEYVGVADLFLTKDYWDDAIARMKEINPNMKFEVHTDDIATASQFFPDYLITNGIAVNWRSVRYAKYLIISNSSFFILPALLGDAKLIIAPRYWARRNTKVWALPQNYYKRFKYI